MPPPQRFRNFAVALLAWLALACGCNRVQPPLVPREPAGADMKTVARDGNAFAFDLYDRLRQENEGNLCFSPYSISTALAMTYAGARGETETQMADVLHFELPQEKLHVAVGGLARDLDATGKNRGYPLSIANRLWARSGSELLDSFLAVTRNHYGAELAQVDFGDADGARRTINAWVEDKTNDRIRELLKPGTVDSSTVLMLTNAVYFKGDWAEKFKTNDTQDAPFHVSADRAVNVPTMQQVHEFRFAETDGVQLLELPYRGDGLSMFVVLPSENDALAAVEGRLNQERLEAWLAKLEKREVAVWLPKFKLNSEFELNNTLIAMGLPLPFSKQADFSGISGSRGPFISAVVHQAFVEVNEEGTEAAAATAVATGGDAAMVSEFRADHPFLFLIRDRHTGSILFLGRVLNPRA